MHNNTIYKNGRCVTFQNIYFKKLLIFSFKNFASSGLLAAPAVWPQRDGME